MKTKLISLALIGGMIFSANAKEAAIKMHVFQQNSNQIEITGQVIGQDDGMPIAGATIYAKSSTKIATITDETGKFRLNVPENEKQIVISYMGYGTLEFNLNQKTNLVISLKPAENVLDQVLVTALGVKKKHKSSCVCSNRT
ncbi:hypothetical protein AAFH68_47230 [Flavobacterium sp. CGRL1]